MRNLLGGQATEQAERECNARLRGKHGMTGGEHEAQEVVADFVISHLTLLSPDLAAEFLVFAFDHLVSAQAIEGAVLRGGHEPGARVLRDTRLRPLLESGDKSILSEFLRHADIAHDSREAGDDAG